MAPRTHHRASKRRRGIAARAQPLETSPASTSTRLALRNARALYYAGSTSLFVFEQANKRA